MISGRPTSASARSSRRSWPPDSVPMPRVVLLGEADQLAQLAAVTATREVRAVLAQRFGHGELQLDARRLQHDPDAVPVRRATGRGIEAQDAHVSRVAVAITLEDLDRGRLPGAVGAEQREDLALVHREVDAAYRVDCCVRLPQPLHLDDVGHGAATTATRRPRSAGSCT